MKTVSDWFYNAKESTPIICDDRYKMSYAYECHGQYFLAASVSSLDIDPSRYIQHAQELKMSYKFDFMKKAASLLHADNCASIGSIDPVSFKRAIKTLKSLGLASSYTPIAIVFNGEHSYLVISNPEMDLSTYSQSICETDMMYVEFKAYGLNSDVILGYADTMLIILKGLDDKKTFDVCAVSHNALGAHNTGSVVAFRNSDCTRLGMFACYTEFETLYSGMK